MNGPRRLRVALACALLLASVVDCGGPAYGKPFLLSFRDGQRAYHAGRYQEAAQHYEAAAAKAQRVKDRDEALFMVARMHERAHDYPSAQASYRRLVEASPRGPRTARAVFEIAELSIERGDAEAGWRLRRKAIERYPSHGSARQALKELVAHEAETRGEAAARAMLEQMLTKLRDSELGQQLAYEQAHSLHRDGQLEAAHDAMLAAARAKPYPSGNLTDDALWNASLWAEQLGNHAAAIAHLRELLASREEALGGSYERPRFPAAQMRIAELHRDRLRDDRAARTEFRKVYRNHGSSLLADDAMWQEVLIAQRLSEVDEACDVAEALVDRYPDSRYVRCVPRLCAGVEVPASKRACPGYIVREIEGPVTPNRPSSHEPGGA
jgi:TolA-binding protein